MDGHQLLEALGIDADVIDRAELYLRREGSFEAIGEAVRRRFASHPTRAAFIGRFLVWSADRIDSDVDPSKPIPWMPMSLVNRLQRMAKKRGRDADAMATILYLHAEAKAYELLTRLE